MSKKLLICSILLAGTLSLHALEITRYVKPEATGDGMTPENPTGNLGAMLALSPQVDKLILNVSPGYYEINGLDSTSSTQFPNVVLDGSWESDNPNEKVNIICRGIRFQNCYIYNVSFSGSIEVDCGIVSKCEIEKQLAMVVKTGDVHLYSCKAKNFTAENTWHVSGRTILLSDCTAEDGAGYGLFAKDIARIKASDCKFINKGEGGVKIDNCLSAEFKDCEFSLNSGDGAMRLVCFDNSAVAEFHRCEFVGNEVTYNHQYNIYVNSNVTFSDCLFASNKEKDIDRKGFLHLTRPDFLIKNCTFVNNAGALELESYYPSKYQILNCAFWNNGPTVVHSDAGNNVPLLCCAMDHGTGIPELDAEKGILLLTKENKGFNFTGTTLEIEPTSILINQGYPRPLVETDFYGHPRTTFGSTDIGCVEFLSSPGIWEADSTVISTKAGDYRLCVAKIGDNRFHLLAPEAKAASGNLVFEYYDRDLLYLDKMPVKPRVHTLSNDIVLIERHLNRYLDTGLVASLCVLDTHPNSWREYKNFNYATPKERPTVKISGNDIEFVKPVPKTTTRKTSTSTRKSSTAKKATKRR